MTRSVDPSKIPDDAWELIEVTPQYRRYQCIVDDNGSYAIKTEYIEEKKLIDLNKELHADSYGKRFGDGQVVARVPLNVLYGQQSEIISRMREGDDEHLRWWLNRESSRPFRTFRGII